MLKIGEFSKLSRVSIRMLRHYDDIGLLKPAEIDDFDSDETEENDPEESDDDEGGEA